MTRPRKLRANACGFTLIELMVCVIMIGILLAIAMPNWISAQNKAKNALIKENMHTVQLAAEAYHTDTGRYAATAAELDPFFPGGSSRAGGTAGSRPPNPLTNGSSDPLYAESLSTTQMIEDARTAPPSAAAGTKGQLGYCSAEGGNSYAICGLDEQGIRMANSTGGTLVLSNQ